MDNTTYMKNVMKTFSNKPAQWGLRRAASNLSRTHLMHAAMGLHNEVAELFEVIEQYLLGVSPITPEMRPAAYMEYGDLGYYMRVLAKCLRVKLPPSTRKVKLVGMTRTAALLKLNVLAAKIAGVQKKVFYGPVMVTIEEPAGPRLVLDKVATLDKELSHYYKMQALLTEFVGLYWAVCFDMFGVPPAPVFAANIQKLAVRYPEGFFDATAVANKNEVAEAAVVD